MDNFNVYKDIEARTGGEIYIGVVGPVRTGKSTFIKRFMETLVLPETTMLGALPPYAAGYQGKDFQPMGANFGVLPPLPEKIRDKRQRYGALAQRGLSHLAGYCREMGQPLEESALGAEVEEKL